MSLSNTVKTHLIDPRVHNNSRTEFKLDDAFYASSFKLIDMGIYDTTRTNTTGSYYPTINGVMQCVKNIYLYSDAVEIDSLRECAQYSSIEALKTTNQGSEDLNRDLLLNGMGLRVKKDSGELTLQPSAVSYFSSIDGAAAVNLQVPISRSAEDGAAGSVLLSNYLQFLKSTSILPMIPDLRLVIEWDTNADDYFLDPAKPGPGSITPLVIRPTLVVDEILGMNPADAKAFNIPYLSTLVERFVVPAVTTPAHDTVPLQSSFKSQAFNQRFLKDLTFFNYFTSELAAANRWLRSKTRSPAQKSERLQLVVNNVTHLPDRGIDNPALKYHFFNDAQTQLNLPLAAGLDEIRDASGNVLDTHTSPLVGQFSVTSVKIGKIIDDLRIEYERVYGDNAWSREGFTLLAYGTIAKNLEVKDGRVRVSY